MDEEVVKKTAYNNKKLNFIPTKWSAFKKSNSILTRDTKKRGDTCNVSCQQMFQEKDQGRHDKF